MGGFMAVDAIKRRLENEAKQARSQGDSASAAKVNANAILEEVKARGLKQFNLAEWTGFCNLRLQWQDGVVEIFRNAQFSMNTGRNRVKAVDFQTCYCFGFGQYSKVPFVQMAVLLSQYGSAPVPKRFGPADIKEASFAGTQTSFSKKLSAPGCAELALEHWLLVFPMGINHIAGGGHTVRIVHIEGGQ